jgi:hypothetical protein
LKSFGGLISKKMDNKLVFYQAVQEFWLSRDEQMSQQRERGRSDQGFRAAVTGGSTNEWIP